MRGENYDYVTRMTRMIRMTRMTRNTTYKGALPELILVVNIWINGPMENWGIGDAELVVMIRYCGTAVSWYYSME